MKQSSSRESTVPRLRERLRETTTRAILEATEAVIAEEGLQAARVEAIAARAGIAVGTIYNYFQHRDALVEALVEARRDEILGRIDEALSGAARRPFREQMLALLQAALAYFDAHRRFISVIFQGELVSKGRSREVMKDIYARYERLVRRGVRERALRSDHAELMTPVLMGAVRATVMHRLVTNDPQPLTEMAEPLTRILLEGMEARK